MTQKILDNRILVLFILPFVIGSLGVFSFAPYNFTLINFLIIPALFLLLSFVNKRSKSKYRKKPYLRNLFFVGYTFGVGFFLSSTYWISNSLTFDKNKKNNHILWDGKDERGFEIKSGLYFVRFEGGNNSFIKKVTYLK